MKKQAPMATVDVPPQRELELQLRYIYLRNSSTKMAQTFNPLQPNQQLHIVSKFSPLGSFQTGVSLGFVVEYTVLYFLADGAAPQSAPEAMDETLAVARINAEFAVDYALAAGALPPTSERLQQFGNGSAMLHTWPYWREYCHATMMRMSLPVMMVPLLTVVQAAPDAALDVAVPVPEVKARKKPMPRKPRTS